MSSPPLPQANNRKKPAALLFYRDGVSEGQFQDVLGHEYAAMRKVRAGAVCGGGGGRGGGENFRWGQDICGMGVGDRVWGGRAALKISPATCRVSVPSTLAPPPPCLPCPPQACQSIEEGYNPLITFVVVQKRHNTRLLPTDPRFGDRSGNILPGTIVDRTICSPFEFDFFLNSHAGIQVGGGAGGEGRGGGQASRWRGGGGSTCTCWPRAAPRVGLGLTQPLKEGGRTSPYARGLVELCRLAWPHPASAPVVSGYQQACPLPRAGGRDWLWRGRAAAAHVLALLPLPAVHTVRRGQAAHSHMQTHACMHKRTP